MSTESDDEKTLLELVAKMEMATCEESPDTVNVDGPSAGVPFLFADPRSWTEHAAYVYAKAVTKMMPNSSPPVEDLKAQAMGIIDRLKPRDPAEELLVSQMLWTHARLMFLTRFANAQRNMKWSALMHTAAERAANLYRKQMLTLAEYRKPRRSPRRHSFTTIRTATIHTEQVVTQPARPSVRKIHAVAIDQANRRIGTGGNPAGEKTSPAQADDGTEAEDAAGNQDQQALADEHGPEDLAG